MPQRYTRRQFVQAVSAAIAAPTIISATAIGADQRPAASDRIVVAIIGCGKMANDYHIPSLLGLADVQVVAVCDVDRSRRLHAKDRVDKHYSKQGASSPGPKELSACLFRCAADVGVRDQGGLKVVQEACGQVQHGRDRMLDVAGRAE